jgi:putative membrane protein
MILLREISGFARLARLARLKHDVATVLARKDRQGEQRAALRLVELYRGRPDLSWGISRFREHANDIHDPGELLGLAEREIVAPLDQQARAVVTNSAKRVATVTALSPIAPISIAYVLIENVRLLRALAILYGGRPGTLGGLKLARLVLTHLVATGGIAMTDDLLGQFLGQDFLRRVSRRLGEGAINGALTARIGVIAVDVIRPLPFLTSKPPRMRDIVAEAMKPLISRAKPEAASVQSK